MKHNFSRELACFNCAQEIMEKAINVTELDPTVGMMEVSNPKIVTAFVRFIGREPTSDELISIVHSLIELAPHLREDCSTFALAHELFHIVED